MSQPFTNIEQIKMSVEAAKNLVGAATMSMDPDQLKEASQALSNAKASLTNVQSNNKDDQQIIESSRQVITDIEEQLSEARQ